MKPFEDFQSGVDPQIIPSIEKYRETFNEIPDSFVQRGVSKPTVNDPMATPGGSGILNCDMFDNSSINLGTR